MFDKNISKRLKLNDNHPTMVKLQRLWELADELNISIGFHGQRTSLIDRDFDPHLLLFIEDVDSNDGPQSFPFPTEYRVVFDNPEYLRMREQEDVERRAREAEERKQKELMRAAQEAAERRATLERQTRRDLEELARLKAKYEPQKSDTQ